MSLPNFAPEGIIYFGYVPWSDDYSNVRLYSDAATQFSEISAKMTIRTEDYVYVAKDRRLKVNIEADRLYRLNYCMFRNASVADANSWKYCFISDVSYVNDNTTEISLEEDIFQTYLYGIDWTIPPCFIERETVPEEARRYLLTREPDFTLDYWVTAQNDNIFTPGAFAVMTSSESSKDTSMAIPFLNDEGYYSKPAKVYINHGIPMGANFYLLPYLDSTGYTPVSEAIQTFLNTMTKAGAAESIIAIFTIPSDFTPATGVTEGWFSENLNPEALISADADMEFPEWGTTVGSYTPKNQKLLYYPYTYARLTDFNGSESQLRYEFMGNGVTAGDSAVLMKYVYNAQCEAIIYVTDYLGIPYNFEVGFPTPCGAQGSWNVDQFANWLSQNAAGLMAQAVGTAAFAVATGGTSLSGAFAKFGGEEITTASSMLKTAANRKALPSAGHVSERYAHARTDDLIKQGYGESVTGVGKLGALMGGTVTGQVMQHMMAPAIYRGNTSTDLMFQTGIQGIRTQKIQVTEALAKRIDDFFSRFGYCVEAIEAINITSRPCWNYIKTQGAYAKSFGVTPAETTPYARGNGTPADVLAFISQCFDNGITFWHNDSIGNFSQDNSLSSKE